MFRWPWQQKPMRLVLGEVYILGHPYSLETKKVRLTSINIAQSGRIDLIFDPE